MINILMSLMLATYLRPTPNWEVGFFLDPIAYGLSVQKNFEPGIGFRVFGAFHIGKTQQYDDNNNLIEEPYTWSRWGVRIIKYFPTYSALTPYMGFGIEGRSDIRYRADYRGGSTQEIRLAGGIYAVGLQLFIPLNVSKVSNQGIAMDLEVNAYYHLYKYMLNVYEDEPVTFGGLGLGWGVYYTW